jgi:hypothetical protein
MALRLTVNRSAACLLDSPEATNCATARSDAVSSPVPDRRCPAADAGELAIGAFEIRLGADPLKNAPRFGCPIGDGLALAEPGQDEAMSGGKARGLEGLGKRRRYRRRLVEGLQRRVGVVTVGFRQAADAAGAHQCRVPAELAGRMFDEGIALFLERFQPDVDADHALPVSRQQIVDYWTRRDREIIAARSS